MQEIPEPKDSGSAGHQEAPRGEVIPPQVASPLAGLEMVRAVQGLAASSPGSIGGAAQAALIAGTISQLYYDLGSCRTQVDKVHQQLHETKDELSKQRTRADVLAERIRSHRRIRHLGNLANAIGAILLAVAVQLYSTGIVTFGVVVAFVAVCLIGYAMISASWIEEK